ncbi:putative leucine-rich repeat-containing protein DDB_G0290503 [Parasteatoda tepidariorum]|uniref:putative leucine-rich repeat-containing protein DDB_G0290503 n=1 Tax=Parasteatoda tepidariorum TaxID=114398 RepID=UPI0039BC29C3
MSTRHYTVTTPKGHLKMNTKKKDDVTERGTSVKGNFHGIFMLIRKANIKATESFVQNITATNSIITSTTAQVKEDRKKKDKVSENWPSTDVSIEDRLKLIRKANFNEQALKLFSPNITTAHSTISTSIWNAKTNTNKEDYITESWTLAERNFNGTFNLIRKNNINDQTVKAMLPNVTSIQSTVTTSTGPGKMNVTQKDNVTESWPSTDVSIDDRLILIRKANFDEQSLKLFLPNTTTAHSTMTASIWNAKTNTNKEDYITGSRALAERNFNGTFKLIRKNNINEQTVKAILPNVTSTQSTVTTSTGLEKMIVTTKDNITESWPSTDVSIDDRLILIRKANFDEQALKLFVTNLTTPRSTISTSIWNAKTNTIKEDYITESWPLTERNFNGTFNLVQKNNITDQTAKSMLPNVTSTQSTVTTSTRPEKMIVTTKDNITESWPSTDASIEDRLKLFQKADFNEQALKLFSPNITTAHSTINTSIWNAKTNTNKEDYITESWTIAERNFNGIFNLIRKNNINEQTVKSMLPNVISTQSTTVTISSGPGKMNVTKKDNVTESWPESDRNFNGILKLIRIADSNDSNLNSFLPNITTAHSTEISFKEHMKMNAKEGDKYTEGWLSADGNIEGLLETIEKANLNESAVKKFSPKGKDIPINNLDNVFNLEKDSDLLVSSKLKPRPTSKHFNNASQIKSIAPNISKNQSGRNYFGMLNHTDNLFLDDISQLYDEDEAGVETDNCSRKTLNSNESCLSLLFKNSLIYNSLKEKTFKSVLLWTKEPKLSGKKIGSSKEIETEKAVNRKIFSNKLFSYERFKEKFAGNGLQWTKELEVVTKNTDIVKDIKMKKIVSKPDFFREKYEKFKNKFAKNNSGETKEPGIFIKQIGSIEEIRSAKELDKPDFPNKLFSYEGNNEKSVEYNNEPLGRLNETPDINIKHNFSTSSTTFTAEDNTISKIIRNKNELQGNLWVDIIDNLKKFEQKENFQKEELGNNETELEKETKEYDRNAHSKNNKSILLSLLKDTYSIKSDTQMNTANNVKNVSNQQSTNWNEIINYLQEFEKQDNKVETENTLKKSEKQSTNWNTILNNLLELEKQNTNWNEIENIPQKVEKRTKSSYNHKASPNSESVDVSKMQSFNFHAESSRSTISDKWRETEPNVITKKKVEKKEMRVDISKKNVLDLRENSFSLNSENKIPLEQLDVKENEIIWNPPRKIIHNPSNFKDQSRKYRINPVNKKNYSTGKRTTLSDDSKELDVLIDSEELDVSPDSEELDVTPDLEELDVSPDSNELNVLPNSNELDTSSDFEQLDASSDFEKQEAIGTIFKELHKERGNNNYSSSGIFSMNEKLNKQQGTGDRWLGKTIAIFPVNNINLKKMDAPSISEELDVTLDSGELGVPPDSGKLVVAPDSKELNVPGTFFAQSNFKHETMDDTKSYFTDVNKKKTVFKWNKFKKITETPFIGSTTSIIFQSEKNKINKSEFKDIFNIIKNYEAGYKSFS